MYLRYLCPYNPLNPGAITLKTTSRFNNLLHFCYGDKKDPLKYFNELWHLPSWFNFIVYALDFSLNASSLLTDQPLPSRMPLNYWEWEQFWPKCAKTENHPLQKRNRLWLQG